MRFSSSLASGAAWRTASVASPRISSSTRLAPRWSKSVKALVVAAHDLEGRRCAQEADRKSRRRRRTGSPPRSMPSFSATRAACSGARAAEGDQRARSSVLAALDRMDARGTGHVASSTISLIAEGGELLRRGPSAGRPRASSAAPAAGDRASSCRRRSASAIDAAQHHDRRRSRSARCRRGRSRPGPARTPRSSGPTAMRPSASIARDRAAAGADLDHLDHRDAQRQAAALLEAVDARATSKPRAVCGSPSSMTQILAVVPPMSKDSTSVDAPSAAPRWPEKIAPPAGPDLDQPHREADRGLDRRQAAARLHQEQRAADSLCARSSASSRREIAAHDRLHVGVGAGRREALVLAHLGRDLAGRARCVTPGSASRQQLARGALLVRGVGVGVQEAHPPRSRPLALGQHRRSAR